MAEAGVSAFVVHELPGRLRLKIPKKRGDGAWFAEISERLARCPGIREVSGKAGTGSLLVQHSPAIGSAYIAAEAERSALFRLVRKPAEPRTTLLQHAAARAEALDRGLSVASRGFLDLRSAILLMLLGMAARQAAQGQIMVPAFSLLVFAAELVARGASREG